jgi:GTPase SAR1 family protein
VACKIDLRDDPEIISRLKQQGEKPIKTKTGKKVASKIRADAYVECSARTSDGVQELFTTAARLILKRQRTPR